MLLISFSMYNIQQLLNRSCSIFVRNHILTLRIAEKLRSHVAELSGIDMVTYNNMYKLGNIFCIIVS